LVVVPGAEYKSENGDIIGIFIEDEIKSKTAFEIIADTKAQGGLVILPHPLKNIL
jgi:predicted metal-dependent phosphoesterase TrpH